jgi:cytochrome oxidase Cu insertion factor (SCO1/SenC/PrrC family)
MGKRVKGLMFELFALALLLGTFLAACGSSPPAVAPTVSGKSEKGKPAPNFSGTDINGNSIKSSDFKGKAILVNFWTTW